MMVHIHLLGYLTRYSPTGQEKFQMDLAPGATVGALLGKIGFPSGIEKMILVNGRQSNPATLLGEEDEVFVFSPATGG
ncbi:MAG: Mut7-C ubiquitin [Deltaproteobacteria bacterium]|jgi:molybdopterin converting factor small subunit|nr:Mut7-C ubiquitin [Deltaproteobacteria bacterium]